MTSRLGTGKIANLFLQCNRPELHVVAMSNGPCLAGFGEGEASSSNSWFLCCRRSSFLLILPFLFLVLLVLLVLAVKFLPVGGTVGPLRAVG